jgi:hypothetical protein
MNDNKGVLVRFEGLAKTSYNVVYEDHWQNWCASPGRSDSWKEVARGTEEEMWALAQLMPDPKILNRS